MYIDQQEDIHLAEGEDIVVQDIHLVEEDNRPVVEGGTHLVEGDSLAVEHIAVGRNYQDSVTCLLIQIGLSLINIKQINLK